MKKILLIIIAILIINISKGQNLVPNSSFELFDTCPDNQGQIFRAVSWTNPTLGGTSDYYNMCSPTFNVPLALMGDQYAINYGNAFGGFYAYISFSGYYNLREYIQTALIDTLKQSHTYNISYYVSLADGCDYAVNKIGVYLSDSIISSNDTSYLPYIPQVESTTFLTDTSNWMQISGYYQAHGGEKYITLGNFRSDTLTDTLKVSNLNGWTFAYYYIDSVTVIDCTATGIIEQQQISFMLLQNPVTNSVGFTSPLQIQTATVFTAVGAMVKQLHFSNTINYSFDIADLPRGLYFLQVETKDKRKGIRKFVKH